MTLMRFTWANVRFAHKQSTFTVAVFLLKCLTPFALYRRSDSHDSFLFLFERRLTCVFLISSQVSHHQRHLSAVSCYPIGPRGRAHQTRGQGRHQVKLQTLAFGAKDWNSNPNPSQHLWSSGNSIITLFSIFKLNCMKIMVARWYNMAFSR